MLSRLECHRAIDRNRHRCALQSGEFRWSATGPGEARPVRLHCTIFFQPRERLAQNLSGAAIRRHRNAIVHPLAVSPGIHDPGAAKIGQVPGYFGLPLPQDLDQVADADLPLSHQVQQAEARIVAQGLKETLHIEPGRFHRHAITYTP